jgi:hypothetical protein
MTAAPLKIASGRLGPPAYCARSSSSTPCPENGVDDQEISQKIAGFEQPGHQLVRKDLISQAAGGNKAGPQRQSCQGACAYSGAAQGHASHSRHHH